VKRIRLYFDRACRKLRAETGFPFNEMEVDEKPDRAGAQRFLLDSHLPVLQSVVARKAKRSKKEEG
jgi:hypothetical protein